MSEVVQRTTQDVEALAQAQGLVPFLPEADELMLDLDEADGAPAARARVGEVLENNGIGVLASLTTTSKSGKYHLYLRLDRPVTPHERIALQACLGSDPVREVLSLLRLMQGGEPAAVTALFETEEEARKVAAWRAGW